jgi:hypothetical protein
MHPPATSSRWHDCSSQVPRIIAARRLLETYLGRLESCLWGCRIDIHASKSTAVLCAKARRIQKPRPVHFSDSQWSWSKLRGVLGWLYVRSWPMRHVPTRLEERQLILLMTDWLYTSRLEVRCMQPSPERSVAIRVFSRYDGRNLEPSIRQIQEYLLTLFFADHIRVLKVSAQY